MAPKLIIVLMGVMGHSDCKNKIFCFKYKTVSSISLTLVTQSFQNNSIEENNVLFLGPRKSSLKIWARAFIIRVVSVELNFVSTLITLINF